jgi:hypothetical protein
MLRHFSLRFRATMPPPIIFISPSRLSPFLSFRRIAFSFFLSIFSASSSAAFTLLFAFIRFSSAAIFAACATLSVSAIEFAEFYFHFLRISLSGPVTPQAYFQRAIFTPKVRCRRRFEGLLQFQLR